MSPAVETIVHDTNTRITSHVVEDIKVKVVLTDDVIIIAVLCLFSHVLQHILFPFFTQSGCQKLACGVCVILHLLLIRRGDTMERLYRGLAKHFVDIALDMTAHRFVESLVGHRGVSDFDKAVTMRGGIF